MSCKSIALSYIRPEPGRVFIYRLINAAEKVIYVGQTKDIKSRVSQHLAYGKEFTDVCFYSCSMSNSTVIERDEIIAHNPPLNKDLPKTDKYITIKQSAKLVSDEIAHHAASTLDIVFNRPEDKKSNRFYVSAAESKEIAESIKEIINKLHAKECK